LLRSQPASPIMMNHLDRLKVRAQKTRRSAIARVGLIVITLLAGLGSSLAGSQSYFLQRPDDPRAVDFTKTNFGAHADGIADDTEALQQAMNQGRGGIVLIPEGRYRLTKTLYITVGTRVIGYGKSRPVFVL